MGRGEKTQRKREKERGNESNEQREMEREIAREKGTPRQCQQDGLEDSFSSPGKIFAASWCCRPLATERKGRGEALEPVQLRCTRGGAHQSLAEE